jgi:hypothetical protein
MDTKTTYRQVPTQTVDSVVRDSRTASSVRRTECP